MVNACVCELEWLLGDTAEHDGMIEEMDAAYEAEKTGG